MWVVTICELEDKAQKYFKNKEFRGSKSQQDIEFIPMVQTGRFWWKRSRQCCEQSDLKGLEPPPPRDKHNGELVFPLKTGSQEEGAARWRCSLGGKDRTQLLPELWHQVWEGV